MLCASKINCSRQILLLGLLFVVVLLFQHCATHLPTTFDTALQSPVPDGNYSHSPPLQVAQMNNFQNAIKLSPKQEIKILHSILKTDQYPFM